METTAMMMMMIKLLMAAAILLVRPLDAGDTNKVYSPCSDTKVQKSDGFTFGVVFSDNNSFYNGKVQLSPCDRRLNLAGRAQLAVFRPRVDEISLLTVNGSSFNAVNAGGYMVAFAGQKHAARSSPIQVANNNHTITSFTLVLEFQKGRLQNLYWKKFGCGSCTGQSVCLGGQDCAVSNSKCSKSDAGGCAIGIQVAFSGTDKNDDVLNSWYEVKNLQSYSLYGLYSDLRNKFTAPFQ